MAGRISASPSIQTISPRLCRRSCGSLFFEFGVKLSSGNLRGDAVEIFRAALAAADAGSAVRKHLSIQSGYITAGNARLRLKNVDRIFLIAVGKAAVQMAATAEEVLGTRLTRGIAVTKRGHATSPLRRTEIIEAR